MTGATVPDFMWALEAQSDSVGNGSGRVEEEIVLVT